MDKAPRESAPDGDKPGESRTPRALPAFVGIADGPGGVAERDEEILREEPWAELEADPNA